MKYFLTLIIFVASGCASVEEVDRSYVNLPQMDLRKSSGHGQISPQSSHRSKLGQSGQGSCSVCSH